MEDVVIEINNLSKKYKDTLAVQSMTFKIYKGQTNPTKV